MYGCDSMRDNAEERRDRLGKIARSALLMHTPGFLSYMGDESRFILIIP